MILLGPTYQHNTLFFIVLYIKLNPIQHIFRSSWKPTVLGDIIARSSAYIKWFKTVFPIRHPVLHFSSCLDRLSIYRLDKLRQQTGLIRCTLLSVNNCNNCIVNETLSLSQPLCIQSNKLTEQLVMQLLLLLKCYKHTPSAFRFLFTELKQAYLLC